MRETEAVKSPEQRPDREMAAEEDLLVYLHSCKKSPEVSPVELLIQT